jgi:branched-chain amino acid transport system substrate-binding protein
MAPAGATAPPIMVGGIASLSGGMPFAQVPTGIEAYFDMINAAGGVHGQMLKYLSYDDAGSPTEAALDARKLVLQDHVVAMVGNTSLVDCDTNVSFYEQQDIIANGTAPQPQCWSNPVWFPINPGPYVSTTIWLDFAYHTLHFTRVCYVGQLQPASIPQYENIIIPAFEKANHVTLTMIESTNDPSQNPTPELVKVKAANCQAMITSTMAPNFVAMVKAAKAVGWDGTMLTNGSSYDATVPGSLGKLGNPGALGPQSKGIFCASELAPFTGNDPATAQMRTWLAKEHVPLNFWSESGWLSAQVFVHVVQSITGKITAASVKTAYDTMPPYKTPLAGSPERFGTYNTSVRIMTVKSGQWQPFSSNWTTTPWSAALYG